MFQSPVAARRNGYVAEMSDNAPRLGFAMQPPRKAKVVSHHTPPESASITAVVLAAATIFSLVVYYWRGIKAALTF